MSEAIPLYVTTTLIVVCDIAAPYDIMVTDGKVHDIDHEDWDRW